jgi:hypothetical protein
MAAVAVAYQLVVGAEDSLRLGTPEVPVAGDPLILGQPGIQVHPFAPQTQAPLAPRFRRLDYIHVVHVSAPSS